mgnify:CR=1 FL=1
MNIIKNHLFKTFLLPGKVNWPLNNILTLKKKNPYFWTRSQLHQKWYPIGLRSKKDKKMFLSFYSWNYPYVYDAVHSLYSNKVSSTFLQKFDHFPCTKNQVKDTILIARKRTIRISKKKYQYWNKKKSKYANEGKIYAKLALNPCGKNSVPNFKGQLKGENKTFLAF